jgi:Flp pilus assembly protein TadG
MYMRLTFAAALALLAACGPKPEAASPVETPEVEAPAPAHQALTGLFTATSTTAMGITGDLAVTPERITLSRGQQLDTAAAAAISPTTRIAAGQPSFAETYVGPTSLALELRKVTSTTSTEGSTPQPLCGATPVSHVVFASNAEQSVVTMLVFSGEEAPGDTATKSQLCGTFTYGPLS